MSEEYDCRITDKNEAKVKRNQIVNNMDLGVLMATYGELKDVRIFTGNSNPELVKGVCNLLNLHLGKAAVGRHANGEQYIRLDETVRGKTCVVIQSVCRSKLSDEICERYGCPKNTWNSPADNFMELALLSDALIRSWAEDVIPAIPYYGFSKQERRKGREPISAEIIARFLQTLNIKGGFSFTLHAPSIAGFFKCPFEDIPLLPRFVDLIRDNGYINDKTKIVAIDSGGVKKAHPVANALGLELDVSHKHRDRDKPEEAETILFAGDVLDYFAIIIEDMVQRGTTFMRGVEALKEHGAKGVAFFATHADICSDKIIDYIEKEEIIKKVFLTDTIPIREGLREIEKVEIISVVPILAEMIYRNIKKLPCTRIFEGNGELVA